jgi:hypothetical protein
MRIDAQHSYSDRHPLDYLESILKRNRFEGSVLVASEIPPELPDYVKAVVVRLDSAEALTDHKERWSVPRGVACSLPTEGLDELQARGLTLDVTGGAEHIADVAARFPKLKICVPLALLPLSPPDGVYVKLLGLGRLPNAPARVREALARYGPSRLMFGSNWPEELPEITWKAALAIFTQSIGAQPIEVREQLLGGTAREFYGI